MSRVSVDAEALKALIEYADSQRERGDSEFNVSLADDEDSQREFDDRVAALDIQQDSGPEWRTGAPKKP